MNKANQAFAEAWEEVEQFRRGRDIRNKIGHALGKAYPVIWLVDVNMEGGIVTISCPRITGTHGMVLHLNRPTKDLVKQAVRGGGELLERFSVNRERPEFDHIIRNARGDAFRAESGENFKIDRAKKRAMSDLVSKLLVRR